MRINWKRIIATGFGTGFLPIGPGSWGTFPGMLLCWMMQPLHPIFYLLVIIILGRFGVYLATEVEKEFKKKDPGAIVIDEIVAFPITMFLIPLSVGTLALGFFLNRLFDTIKFWPCNRLEKLPGGWGIMLDDLAAAIYSCISMHIVVHYWPKLLQYHPISSKLLQPFS
jgi:phosphatidylglycerophosphatase A